MSNMQESTFNVKRAKLVFYISSLTYLGLILFLGFANVIDYQTFLLCLFAGTIAGSLTNYGLRKYEKEQKENKKEIERYKKW